MKFDNVKIVKMGSRLGIAFSRHHFSKGKLVQIIILKESRQKAFLAKFNRIITLRRCIKNPLNLKHNELLTLEIQEIINLDRTKELFQKGKIDMLSLVPEITSKGYEIIVTEFSKNNESWLRIWYSHERGSGQQLEIRRFVETVTMGNLLGQYQAEGTKHKNTDRFRVEFKNKLITEHEEFIKSLSELGIPKQAFEFVFVYNPNKISELEVQDYVDKFKSTIDCEVKLSRGNSKGIGFGAIVRNTLLTEILINSLNKIREILANEAKYTNNQQRLVNRFFAKLLTGDGTLDIGYRGRDSPNMRIKIVDADKNYLQDYRKIMENLGFHPRINEKHIFVISSCSFKNLLYLYSIRAFKNSNNWNKIIVAIALCLNGRRYNTYSRFLELIDCHKFGTSVISKSFRIKSNMASDWLNNKVKENLIIKNNYNSWSLTSNGKNLGQTLKIWSKDYKNLKYLKGLEDPFALLKTLKVKKFKILKCLPE